MKGLEKTVEVFTSLMADKIKSLEVDYHQPWVNVEKGRPRNIRGTYYSGINTLMLSLYCEKMNFVVPVFLTFKQAQEHGLAINKGAKSFPVYHFNIMAIKNDSEEKLSINEYNGLPVGEQADYKVIFTSKVYNVFNVEQTNIKIHNPKLWKQLLPIQDNIVNTKFECSPIDEMILNNNWPAKIIIKPANIAAYMPLEDYIICPEKRQFPDESEFYATLLHEIVHSTGIESRLNRDAFKKNTDNCERAKEELIAELSAAIIGSYLGVSIEPHDQNACYLKSWLNGLGEGPDYLMSIFGEVVKACKWINEYLTVIEKD